MLRWYWTTSKCLSKSSHVACVPAQQCDCPQAANMEVGKHYIASMWPSPGENELYPGIFQHDELTVGAPIGALVCASEL